MNELFVMIGGAVGAMSRYAAGVFLMKKFPHPPIPIAMLFVNVIGSLGLGLFLGTYFSFDSNEGNENPLYLLIVLGFFGAFTTFSTFSIETIQLLRDSKVKEAFIYVICSLLLSFCFFAIGYWIG